MNLILFKAKTEASVFDLLRSGSLALFEVSVGQRLIALGEMNLILFKEKTDTSLFELLGSGLLSLFELKVGGG